MEIRTGACVFANVFSDETGIFVGVVYDEVSATMAFTWYVRKSSGTGALAPSTEHQECCNTDNKHGTGGDSVLRVGAPFTGGE